MLIQERIDRIMELFKKKDIVKLQDIVEEIDVSESTARRDLNTLEKQGRLERVHGGARLAVTSYEEDFKSKNIQRLSEKKEIGRVAGRLVDNGQCIFIDAGTTTEAMIPFLEGKNITVVTNGVTHIEHLSRAGIKTIIIEGEIKHKTAAIVGGTALKSLEKYYFDISFVGANGIDIDRGVTTPDIEEANIKSLVIKNSKKTYILADSSKFNKVTFRGFAKLDEVEIITDRLDDKRYSELKNIKECR